MVTKKEAKEHEEWVRKIAREEALKCIIEEDRRKLKETIEFMEKIQLPKNISKFARHDT